MSKYNVVANLEDIQQILCNLVAYILWLFDNNYINERTKNELLKRINPEVYEKSKSK